MSGGLDILSLKEDDLTKLLTACTHLGSQNCDFQMEQYVYKVKSDGTHLINLRRTWEKLMFAARAIAAIENPADVCVISARPYGQRAILKFAASTGATPIAGRFTPGTFTNQIQAAFREPRLLIVTDPRTDHQPITEASYVNIPVVALCNTDSPLKYVDIAIPCNNKAPHSIGLMWWFLAREVLRLRGTIGREVPWEVMVDLYFYRDPEEAEKEEQAALEAKQTAKEPEYQQPDQWAESSVQPADPIFDPANPPVAASAAAGFTSAPAPQEDWATDTGDWAATAPSAAAATAATTTATATTGGDTGVKDWGGAGAEDWN